jgi:streptogramin lyase
MGTLALLIAAVAASAAPAIGVDLCITEFSVGITPGAAPIGITAGPGGSLWFVESAANKIGRITAAGVVTEFSIPAAGSQAQMITAGPDGNLWFTEFAANKIGRITTAGVVTEFSVSGNPWGIAVGPDGNLWFTTFYGSHVGRITTAGVVTNFPVGSTTTLSIAAGPDGNLWFTEPYEDRVGRITTAGVVTEFSAGISPNSDPHGIIGGPDGNVWFVETTGNRVGRITPTGVVTEFSAGISPGSGLEQITVGADGNLWFTEATGDRIGRITPAGVVTEFSEGITPGAYPYDVDLGSDGALWFTEYYGDRIGRSTCPMLERSFCSVGSSDGWVLEGSETSGEGGTFDAAATTARVGDDASDRQYRSILHFDTSGLPNDAVVVGVTLRIKRQAFTGTSPFTTHGNLQVDLKKGAFSNSAVLQTGDFKASASKTNAGKFLKAASKGWYRANFGAGAYPLINLTGTTQFRLRFATDDNEDMSADYLSFYTGNTPTAANRPELIVTYYVP